MNNEIKIFLIKTLITIIAIILIINTLYNLIIASKLEPLLESFNKVKIENKIRDELSRALEKDKILYEEDKILLKKLYIKLKKEFESD